jgi:hypothetical protein
MAPEPTMNNLTNRVFAVIVGALVLAFVVVIAVAITTHPTPTSSSAAAVPPLVNTAKKLTPKQQAAWAAALRKQQVAQDKQQAKQQAAQDKELRVQYAQIIDNATLDMGIESTTRATGPDRTTLYIKDVLAGRVGARAIERGLPSVPGLIALKALGFRKVIYTNGFESELGETYSWTIE